MNAAPSYDAHNFHLVHLAHVEGGAFRIRTHAAGSALSDTLGLSGRSMLEAIINGECIQRHLPVWHAGFYGEN